MAFASVVVVSATGAFFTDVETSDTNVFTAGTLELDINANGTTAPFITDLGSPVLNPGEKTGLATISIKNGGSTDLGWFGYFNTSGNDAMLDAVYIDFAQMEFNVNAGTWAATDNFIVDGNGSGPYAAHYLALANSIFADGKISLREWNAAGNQMMGAGGGVMMGALKAAGDYEYKFTFRLGMLEDVPNALQGATLNMNYTLAATQITTAALQALDLADSRINILDAAHQATVWMPAQLADQVE